MGHHSPGYLCRLPPRRHGRHRVNAAVVLLAADKAASSKEVKYRQLANSHIFVPEARVSRDRNHQTVELVQELGRRMTAVTEDTKEATHLFQRMSVALQWEMRSPSTALSPPSKRRCGLRCLFFNISYLRELSTEG